MRREALIAVVAVLLLATLLRFHLLEAQSFWNDEGNSARLSERAIPAILEGTASDVHPPLYYLILRGWRELVGETEFGLRSFSAFAGVLTVAVVIALARLAAGNRGALVALVAGLLAAVSPVLVYYSQETRMYALLALLASASAWILGRWLIDPKIRFAVTYVALLAAGLYTHYFFPAVVAGQGLVVLLWGLERRRRPGAWRRVFVWCGLAAAAVILYAPWVPIFLRQVGGRAADRSDPLDFFTEAWRWLAVGPTLPAEVGRWAGLGLAGLLVLGVALGRKRAVAPLLLAGVPIGFSFLAGATDPAFFKFLLTAVPFLCVIGGLAFSRKPSGMEKQHLFARLAYGLAALFLGLSLIAAALSLRNIYTDPAYARADYRGMAARIAADAHPNAGVILVAPNQWEAFTYYHKDGAPVYPLPRGRATAEVLEPALEQIAADHDRLYALFWGETQRDPERIVERWLDDNAFKASEEWVGDVRFVVYAVPPTTDASFAAPVEATFSGLDGESLRLVAAGTRPAAAKPGDIIQVQLQWQADGPTARPYKVFVHLIDAAGSLVGQRDSEPMGGSRPTTSWAAGETITDNHGLLIPAATPPGSYELRLGLYDAYDPAARLVVSPGGGDTTVLGSFEVR